MDIPEVKLDISADAILKTVQEKRLRMLLGMEQMDKHQRYLMNEMAETAVQVKRIESDETVAGEDREAALAFSNIIANLEGNPFLSKGERELKIINPEVPQIDINPGETLVEIEELDYDDFVKKR